jgi:alpha-glucosidase (family GH31 glycosyl hydrolase)
MFHFPEDDETFTNTEHSFIWANALKVTPVLDADASHADTIKSYFPEGEWVNMNNYSDIVNSTGGSDGWKDLPNDQSNMSMIHSHLMPGAIVTK